MLHREMLIGGQAVTGAKAVVRAPFDGRTLGTAAEAGPHEARLAIESAHTAFQTWRNSPRHARQGLLRRIAEAVRQRSEEFVDLLTDEVGKPLAWSRGEVARLAVTFDLAADLVSSYGLEAMPVDFDERGPEYRCLSERFPIGPILAIVPYNWPFNLAAHKIAPALAVGDTLVLKPSPLAPLSTLTLAHLIHRAGCPPGVLNAVGCGPEIAESMAKDPSIAMVSFTGSPGVGWHLKSLLPEKRVILELGGNASAIVSEDADLDWAVLRCVAGGYGYAGQVCIAVQHVLAHQGVYGAVRERLIAATLACPAGDPRDPTVVCGPMISGEAADRVEAWVAEAVQAGARVIAGGGRDGNVVKPTLVEQVPPQVRLAQEEVFGPVLTLAPYASLDEAIATVNSSDYGIQCGIFTHDLRIADQAFRDLEVGGVVVNDYPTLRFDNFPYGGVKRSGFGREGVRYAMDEMTEQKTMLVRAF